MAEHGLASLQRRYANLNLAAATRAAYGDLTVAAARVAAPAARTAYVNLTFAAARATATTSEGRCRRR